MKTLKEELEEFEKQILKQKINENADEKGLQELLKKLAPAFLYGGYIKVRNEYRVYIRTVEFYFHCEKKNGIHDPIVYHRDGNGLKKVPYFPLMTLHSHDSGFDITFESEAGEYRASALIRAYEVIRIQDGKSLIWYTGENKFVEAERNQKGKYMVRDTKKQKDVEINRYNTQSTYLKKILNGFYIEKDCENNRIMWVDDSNGKDCAIEPKPNVRKNVPYYREVNGKGDFEKVTKNVYEKYKETLCEKVLDPKFFTYNSEEYLQDPRKWQFEIL